MNRFSKHDIEAFQEVLTEAIHWCASRASLEDQCQSLRTLPTTLGEDSFLLSPEARGAHLASLAAERAFRIRASGGLQESSNLPRDGKLLLFYPDRSLSDGAAEVASHGFFDNDNIPAWDTWVYYGTDGSGSTREGNQDFLVCWIPSKFVPLVSDGIAVNPEVSIEWASTRDRPFTRALKAWKMMY